MEFSDEPNGDQPSLEPKQKPEQEASGQKTTTPIEKVKAIAQNIWNFLKSPVFLKNIGLMAALLIVGFFVLKGVLRMYTNHNESMQVDNYIGMDVEDAQRKIRKKDFEIEIKEIFGQPANEVTMQYPDPMSRVKEGRTIYLTVKNGQMDEVEIPDFSNMDNFDTYKKHLVARGLYFTVEEQFNAKLSDNTVLNVVYKGKKLSGLDLRRGVKAFVGDTVKCIVTTRYSPTVTIPNLVCQNYEGATFLLESHKLVIGRVFGEVADRNSAYVWKQDPAFAPGQQIQKGRQIDIYLTDDYPEGCN